MGPWVHHPQAALALPALLVLRESPALLELQVPLVPLESQALPAERETLVLPAPRESPALLEEQVPLVPLESQVALATLAPLESLVLPVLLVLLDPLA